MHRTWIVVIQSPVQSFAFAVPRTLILLPIERKIFSIRPGGASIGIVENAATLRSTTLRRPRGVLSNLPPMTDLADDHRASSVRHALDRAAHRAAGAAMHSSLVRGTYGIAVIDASRIGLHRDRNAQGLDPVTSNSGSAIAKMFVASDRGGARAPHPAGRASRRRRDCGGRREGLSRFHDHGRPPDLRNPPRIPVEWEDRRLRNATLARALHVPRSKSCVSPKR